MRAAEGRGMWTVEKPTSAGAGKPDSRSGALSVRPGQHERLDFLEGAHALDRVVDAVERIAGGEHRLEVVPRRRATHELQRLPELADVRGLHAENRRLLADEQGGLHGREWASQLPDDGIASARPEEVETFGERIRCA